MILSREQILAKQLAARQEKPSSPQEQAFKLHARKKQSTFRQMVLGIPYDPKNKKGKYGAFLMEPWATKGFNFCEEYRQEILEGIHNRYENIDMRIHEGLMCNMLRSEHIPWNIFYPMNFNMEASVPFFKEILGFDKIDKVIDIRIEWAPEKETALDDNTSFDTYVEYIFNGERYGIGIEVKYTEKGYPIGVQEKERIMNQPECLYATKTRDSGLYVKEVSALPLKKTIFCNDDYRQIWRNHLLGESMVMNGQIKGFHSLTLYPKGNPHFPTVFPVYEKNLSEYGKSSFHHITYEKLIQLMFKHFPKTERNYRWIDYLNTRYPFI